MALDNSILFIATSHSKLGDSDIPTGYYLPEVAHAYYVLCSRFQIVFASPAGGIPPRDPNYPHDDLKCVAFLQDPVAMAGLNNSLPLDSVDSSNYVAVFFPGGNGPMFDLSTHSTSQRIAREIYEAGGIVGAVCHGPAGIVNVKLSNGEFLVDGKNVTGFSNREEIENGKTQYMPYLLEDQLRANGGKYSQGDNWSQHVVVDGRLVTGQNPASTAQTATLLTKH